MRNVIMATVAVSLSFTPLSATGQEKPPVPSAPRPVNLPQPVEKVLPNGLRVIVVPRHNLPIVAARLIIRTGGEADPARLPGLADMTASLLPKGTKSRSANEIAQGIEALGATMDSGAGWDNSHVTLSVMSGRFDEAMGYVADIVRNPRFSDEEIERLRQQTLDSLRVAMKQPRALASMVASRVVFGAGAYGHPLTGTPDAVRRIGKTDVEEFHRAHFRPANAILVIAGDLTPERAFAIAGSRLGSWKGSGGGASAAPAAAAASPRYIVIDVPDAGQAAVVVAKRGIRRADASYNAAIVTNSILGGGYSSRLNEEVRIKRGLSYGASSSFDFRKETGPFMAVAQTKNESAVEVSGLILAELEKLTTTEVPDDEIGPRKAVLIGAFGRSLETTSGIVNRLAGLALYGLSLDEINQTIHGIEGVKAADVKTFAVSHLSGADASVIIAGDARKFLEAMKQRFKTTEVVPLSRLDPGSPGLRRK